MNADWVLKVPYRIETSRLVLRAPEPAGAAQAKAAIDPNLAYLAPWLPFAAAGPVELCDHVQRLREWRAKFDRDADYQFEVLDAQSGALVGCAGLMVDGDRMNRPAEGQPHRVREIGYWIAEAMAGRGLATELTGALVRVGFELLGLARLEIRVAPANRPSVRVAEKAGFQLEGLTRDAVPFEARVASFQTAHAKPPSPEDAEPRRDLEVWSLLPGDVERGVAPAASGELRAYSVVGESLL